MDLKALTAQYDEEADVLLERIARLREELSVARGTTVFQLVKRIELLQVQARDVRKLACYMRAYYD